MKIRMLWLDGINCIKIDGTADKSTKWTYKNILKRVKKNKCMKMLQNGRKSDKKNLQRNEIT